MLGGWDHEPCLPTAGNPGQPSWPAAYLALRPTSYQPAKIAKMHRRTPGLQLVEPILSNPDNTPLLRLRRGLLRPMLRQKQRKKPMFMRFVTMLRQKYPPPPLPPFPDVRAWTFGVRSLRTP